MFKTHKLKILTLLVSALASGAAFAQGASKPTTRTVAPKFVSVTSPPSTPTPSSTHKTLVVRIPIGDARLQAIKQSAEAAPRHPRSSPVGDTKSPTGEGVVIKSCATNTDASNTLSLTPSDIQGAAGVGNLVVTTNSRIEVHSKSTCAALAGTSLNAFFGLPSSILPFDPRVIYDEAAGRFIVTAETEDLGGSSDQIQFVAVSTSGTGLSYFVYGLTLSSGGSSFCKQSASSFWDFPSVGKDFNRIFITANDFGASVPASILDWNKAPMLTGGSTTVACFAGVPFGIAPNLAPPIVLDGNLGAIFLSPGSGSGSSLARYKLLTTGGGPGADVFSTLASIAVPAWTAAPDAAQPNGILLDTIDGRFQSASIQSRGLLWNVHAINFGGAAADLYKIDSGAGTLVLNKIFFTSGTDKVFNPSVATGSGAFNAPAFVTATRTDPGAVAPSGNASHLVFSGLNSSLTDWLFNVIIVSGVQYTGGDCSGACRWGDYSATQVDPKASGLGWSFNQYITGTSQFSWATRAGGVNLKLPAAPVVGNEQ